MDILTCLSAVALSGLPSGGTVFVDTAAPAGGDGSTWATAFDDLRDAFTAAQETAEVLAIHIAAGTYYPDGGTGDPELSLLIPARDGFSVLGGYPAGGGAIDERDPTVHETVLSGDLLNNDELYTIPVDPDDFEFRNIGTFIRNGGDNSSGLLLFTGESERVTLGGLTLSACNGSTPDYALNVDRGGMRLEDVVFDGNRNGARFTNAEHLIEMLNCRFERNRRGVWAISSSLYIRDSAFNRNSNSALVVERAPLVVENTDFIENYHPGLLRDSPGGAGLRADREATLLGCRFLQNGSGGAGGGAWIDGPATVQNCVFEDNKAAYFGGASFREASDISESYFGGNIALRGAGGAHILKDSSVDHCVIEGNETIEHGGGGLFLGNEVFVQDCVIRDNASPFQGGGIEASTSNAIIRCEITGNCAGRYGGGALVLLQNSIISCVVTDNHSEMFGGGIASLGPGQQVLSCLVAGNTSGTRGGGVASSSGSLIANKDLVVNTTIVDNTAPEQGGVSYLVDLVLANDVIWGNSGDGSDPLSDQIGSAESVSHSIIEGADAQVGIGVIGIDPGFVNPLGADGIRASGDENYRLSAASPGINAGDPGLVPRDAFDVDGDSDVLEPLPFDVIFLPRSRGVSGGPALPDLGAYEFNGISGCNLADLAVPYGTHDLADLISYVLAFVRVETRADIEAPFDVWDLADIVRFVEDFEAGCGQ